MYRMIIAMSAFYRGTGLQEVGVVVKPFDWTYTTDYKGTLSSKGTTNLEVRESICIHSISLLLELSLLIFLYSRPL